MQKFIIFFLSLLVTSQVAAFEPVMDQQGMFYFNLSFDAAQVNKAKHQFGFRLDRAMVKPTETMTMSQLHSQPAVFDVAYNSDGLQSFKLHGIDYAYDEYVYRGAEVGETAVETETTPVPEQQTPRKKVKIPLGVVIGGLIAMVAITSGF